MKRPTIHLICNAHLDPVWQWSWEEGCGEALSTFATAVDILHENSELIFNHNEAVLYQWVREYDPALFREIQALVAAGRWCISGGWFIQPDVNMPDTEALIRHILVGRRFFREHFGVEPKVAYNFDSFGHGGGLPQLLARTGYRMYIHMRPHQDLLPLPSDLYWWRGVDGSKILAMRIAIGYYHTERDNLEQRMDEGVELALRLNRDVPVFWGLGDHGGGPTREDLRRIEDYRRRETRVEIVHSTTERLYEALQAAAAGAPVIEGDLQRIFTGCYTSLARIKRQAVRSLGQTVQTEALRAASWWQLGQPYPEEPLADAWRDHLFNDFHDILPGSCVESAEQDALKLYGRVEESVRRLRLGAAAAFNAGRREICHVPMTVLNTNPVCRQVPVEAECMLDLRPKWTGKWSMRLFTLDGVEIPCQEEQAEPLQPYNGWRRKIVFMADLPALGARHYKIEIAEGEREAIAAPACLRHSLDPASGLVTSLNAGGGCECLRGPMLQPLVVNDTADSWGSDAMSYREVVGRFACVPGSVMVLEQGPIRTITESVHQFNHSRIVFHTIAYAHWPVLEFRLRINWQEPYRRLKLAIPTVFDKDCIRCEVPGGAIDRPADGQEHVHRRWILLSDSVQGKSTALAVVHDGLHGFDFQDGEIRLSALRSAAYCHVAEFKIDEPPARKYMDQGIHEIRLLVTAGEAKDLQAKVTGLADWFNMPPATYAHLPIGRNASAATPHDSSLISCHPENIRLLACKRSWDGQALIIRLQEVAGWPTEANVRIAGNAKPGKWMFNKYEIKTLRFERNEIFREVDWVCET